MFPKPLGEGRATSLTNLFSKFWVREQTAISEKELRLFNIFLYEIIMWNMVPVGSVALEGGFNKSDFALR